MQGLGIVPAIIAGVSAAVSAIQKMVKPRGDYQKFERTVYPYATQHAASTGVPCIIMWFGEVLRVTADGQYIVLVGKDNTAAWTSNWLQNWEAFKKSYSEVEAFYDLVGDDCVNHPESCSWQLYGIPGQGSYVFNIEDVNPTETINSQAPIEIIPQGGESSPLSTAGFSGSLPVLIAGVAALYFFSKGRKKR